MIYLALICFGLNGEKVNKSRQNSYAVCTVNGYTYKAVIKEPNIVFFIIRMTISILLQFEHQKRGRGRSTDSDECDPEKEKMLTTENWNELEQV